MDKQNIRIRSQRENGQSLLLIALTLVGMIGMLVLVLDVGQTYMWRREAQTAADAGAYAGAATYCSGGTDVEAATVAIQYAEVHNNADPGTTTVNTSMSSRTIQVITHISYNTWFGTVLGRPDAAVEARASSGCFALGSASGIIPLAFTCRPPIGGTVPSSLEECQLLMIPYSEFEPHEGKTPDELWQLYPNQLYVVMDDNKYGDQCIENDYVGDPNPGTIICDVDGDGEIDVIGGGDRGWLNLNGGAAQDNELGGWILDGDAPEVFAHWWYGSTGGTHNASIIATDAVAGTIRIVPIIDGYCPDQNINSIYDMNPDCFNATLSHPLGHYDPDDFTQGDNYVEGVGKVDYYHVIGFAAFYISCVEGGSTEGAKVCPGHSMLDCNGDPDLGITGACLIGENDKSVEGYFIAGYRWDSGTPDPDALNAFVNVILLQE